MKRVISAIIMIVVFVPLLLTGAKPFAVLFPDIPGVRSFCAISPEEEALLLSSPRPIVLLRKKRDFAPSVCSESDRIGAMLPSNPLQILLTRALGPLILTSLNRSGAPMVIRDGEALAFLSSQPLLSGVLWHEREMAYQSQLSPDCRKQCTGCGAAGLLKGGVCDA